MTSRNWGIGALGVIVGAVVVWLLPPFISWFAVPYRAEAQERPPVAPPTAERQTTVTGRVIDLHCFMTGEYPTKDRAKCTAECLRNGVPAVLETETGLVVLGQGVNGPAKTLVPYAFQQVEVRGKLYEKSGVKYVDITSVKKVPAEEPEEIPEP